MVLRKVIDMSKCFTHLGHVVIPGAIVDKCLDFEDLTENFAIEIQLKFVKKKIHHVSWYAVFLSRDVRLKLFEKRCVLDAKVHAPKNLERLLLERLLVQGEDLARVRWIVHRKVREFHVERLVDAGTAILVAPLIYFLVLLQPMLVHIISVHLNVLLIDFSFE